MDKNLNSKQENVQREQMIAFIIRTIKSLDNSKLRNIYHFILHIM